MVSTTVILFSYMLKYSTEMIRIEKLLIMMLCVKLVTILDVLCR